MCEHCHSLLITCLTLSVFACFIMSVPVFQNLFTCISQRFYLFHHFFTCVPQFLCLCFTMFLPVLYHACICSTTSYPVFRFIFTCVSPYLYLFNHFFTRFHHACTCVPPYRSKRFPGVLLPSSVALVTPAQPSREFFIPVP